MSSDEDSLEAGTLANGAAVQAITHPADGSQTDDMSLLPAVHIHDVHVDPEMRITNFFSGNSGIIVIVIFIAAIIV